MKPVTGAGLAALLLAACTSSPPEATPEQKMRTLARHLATAETPAGWTLVRYRLRDGDGFIDANLDFKGRVDALAVAPGDRFDYFTTPCPDRNSQTWRVFRSHERVYIRVNIDGRQAFLAPCRR